MKYPDGFDTKALPPVLKIVLMLQDPPGEKLEREYNTAELPEHLTVPPSWLKNPRRSWPNPGDPVLLTGTVRRGNEAEARAWLGVE